MRNSRWIVPAVIVVLVLGFAYLWFSPYLALRGIRQAIQHNDPSGIERYVDFPRVRESLKSQLNRALMSEVNKDDSGFGALGLAFAGPIIDRLVDAYITPEGLASIGTGENPEQGDVETVRNWQVQRRGFSEVLIHPKDSPNDGLIMERRGLGWKVVRLQINLDKPQ